MRLTKCRDCNRTCAVPVGKPNICEECNKKRSKKIKELTE